MTIFYAMAQNAPLLELEQERQLLSDWQEHGDKRALEALISSHARLVFAAAQKLSMDVHVREELISEGVLGLIRAADMFDLSRDVRFSTYARWWVQNGVRAALAKVNSVVDVPASERGKNSLLQLRTAGPDEDADNTDILDQISSDEPTPEEQVIAQSALDQMREQIASALADLGDTEREVVTARNLNTSPESFEDLSQRFGLSRERLRQIERRALSRLKHELMQRGVTSLQAV